jgi:hypothetical protein
MREILDGGATIIAPDSSSDIGDIDKGLPLSNQLGPHRRAHRPPKKEAGNQDASAYRCARARTRLEHQELLPDGRV